jgi:hypothetical protein
MVKRLLNGATRSSLQLDCFTVQERIGHAEALEFAKAYALV